MHVLVLSIILFFSSFAALNDVNKATEAYKNKDYETAERLFREAIMQNPEDQRLYYNLATTLAAQGKSDEALSMYNQYKSLTDIAANKANADYNVGKSLADQEKWKEALKAFQSALIQNPNDPEAKHNYELAKQKLQEQQQQEQEQDQQQNQDQNKDQQENEKKEQDQNQDQKDQDEKQQDQQQQNQDQQDKQDQQQQQQQQREPQVSKEEAKKLLDALEKKEKDLLKQFKKKQTKPTKKNAKDW